MRRSLVDRANVQAVSPLAAPGDRPTTANAPDSPTTARLNAPTSDPPDAPSPTNATDTSRNAQPQSATDAQPATDAPSTAQPFAPASQSPRDIWAGVLRAVSDKPSLSWVRSLGLQTLDGQTARVAPLPGKQHVRRFIADRQRQQLADLIRPLIDRPVKVELIDEPPKKGAAQPRGDDGEASPAPSRPDGRGDRNEAMKLPLVQQVLEEFDATLIDTFEENDSR